MKRTTPVNPIFLLFCTITLLLGVDSLQAQAQSSAPENKTKTESTRNGNTDSGRDPFALPENVKKKIEEEKKPEFIASKEDVSIPQITLKGYLEVKNEKPFALIEIQGQGMLIVREGDTISLQRKQSHVLKIIKLSNLSVSIQIGKLGQVIVVRS